MWSWAKTGNRPSSLVSRGAGMSRGTLSSAQPLCAGNAINGDGISSLAQGDFFSRRLLRHLPVGARQDFVHFRVYVVFVPEDLLKVLRPFKIGNGHPASVGQYIGQDDDSA